MIRICYYVRVLHVIYVDTINYHYIASVELDLTKGVKNAKLRSAYILLPCCFSRPWIPPIMRARITSITIKASLNCLHRYFADVLCLSINMDTI